MCTSPPILKNSNLHRNEKRRLVALLQSTRISNPLKRIIMHRKNLVGQTFERLTVLKDNGRNSRRYILWLCKCSCGKDIDAIGYELENGHVKSCGCLKAERLGNNSRTHGKSKTSEYSIWCGMIKRIENPNDKFYSEYGGRGIKICDRWRHSFEFFNQDMGSRPTKNHSI